MEVPRELGDSKHLQWKVHQNTKTDLKWTEIELIKGGNMEGWKFNQNIEIDKTVPKWI